MTQTDPMSSVRAGEREERPRARPHGGGPPGEGLIEHRLDNGLRVVLHPDRRLPLVALNIWYHVGSKDERPGLTGFAHLFEHMLFQGSEHVSGTDFFRHIQQVGGVANGSTWYDRTNYFVTLPSRHMDLGLWLESDRMGYFLPGLDSRKLETQRSVVMNERRQRVDNQPYGRALERLSELLYPGDHPYHWPVMGYMDDIAAATLEDVRRFFRTHYTPDNAVLTLAGRLDPDDALERVDRWFGPIGPAAAGERPERAPLDPPDPRFRGERRDRLADDVRLPRVYMAYQAPPYGEPEWYAADLLSEILTTGKSSLLHEDLVYRRELARHVAGFVLPTELAATFALIATGNPGRRIDRVEEEILAHLERIATDGPAEHDLERARNRVLYNLYESLQTLQARADLISQCATLFDDPSRAFAEAARYAAVTPEDVRAFARAHLIDGGRAVVTVVPQSGRSGRSGRSGGEES
jgi:zinc protease